METNHQNEIKKRMRIAGARCAFNRPSNFLSKCIEQAAHRLRTRPGALWENLLGLEVDESMRQIFERARSEGSDFALPLDVIFPQNHFPIVAVIHRDFEPIVIADSADLREFQAAVSGAWQDLPAAHPTHEFALELRDAGILTEPGACVRFDCPGVHRLQHASVLFRSSSGAGVISDPVCQGPGDWIVPQDLDVDAVVVSHSHEDHFDLGTLLQFPRHTTMIVPAVPQRSMLCPDMAALLRDAGFDNVIAAPWFSTVQVKDIAVHIYPFYGEQPWLRFAAPDARLRNHGNTCVVEMDGFKIWFLIDSGREFRHSMEDLCDKVRNDLGAVDIVMSNLREFHWHPQQIDCSGRYLFCFPAEKLDRPEDWPDGELMTFGPAGLRPFLQKLKPKYFLPYAHWWHPRQCGSHLVDGWRTEAEMLAGIREGGTGVLETELREWNVGCRLELSKDRRISIHELTN